MTFLKKHLPVTIIVIFHLVGFIGFLISPAYFRALTPFNLLLSGLLLLITSGQTKWKFYAVMTGVALAGYFVEVAGVKTGLIFGHYHYGSALGIKWLSVPLLIGLNWALLIYATSQFFSFSNKYVNAFFAAILMVALDFFIEQSAARFDFWYWQNARIPLQNYIAWFIISFVIHVFSDAELSKKPNITAKAFFVVQVVFFAALYIFA
ncbi:MAG: carotenoid biosynthesis protein [Bacteroidota bacterium]